MTTDSKPRQPAIPSPDRYAELRELLAKGTPLPWCGDPDSYAEYIWGPNLEMVAQMRGTGAGLPKAENQAKLLAAVNALPGLLDELAKLRSEREALLRYAAEYRQGLDSSGVGIRGVNERNIL